MNTLGNTGRAGTRRNESAGVDGEGLRHLDECSSARRSRRRPERGCRARYAVVTCGGSRAASTASADTGWT